MLLSVACCHVCAISLSPDIVLHLRFHPIAKRVCMRSKAWVAASVWLRRARLPPPASRVWRSRRQRDTLAAAPGLLAHAWITEVVSFCPIGPTLRYTAVPVVACFMCVREYDGLADVFLLCLEPDSLKLPPSPVWQAGDLTIYHDNSIGFACVYTC